MLVILLPEYKYDAEFLKDWVCLIDALEGAKIKFIISQAESCNSFYAKQMTLGGRVDGGQQQRPFQGKLKYNKLLMLSPKAKFKPTLIFNLLDSLDTKNLDLVSAYNEKNMGPVLNDKGEVLEVEYVDFECAAFKFGTIERLAYPWFRPHNPKTDEELNFLDIDACRRLRKRRIPISVIKELEYERR